jgi:hypothetical protein
VCVAGDPALRVCAQAAAGCDSPGHHASTHRVTVCHRGHWLTMTAQFRSSQPRHKTGASAAEQSAQLLLPRHEHARARPPSQQNCGVQGSPGSGGAPWAPNQVLPPAAGDAAAAIAARPPTAAAPALAHSSARSARLRAGAHSSCPLVHTHTHTCVHSPTDTRQHSVRPVRRPARHHSSACVCAYCGMRMP